MLAYPWRRHTVEKKPARPVASYLLSRLSKTGLRVLLPMGADIISAVYPTVKFK